MKKELRNKKLTLGKMTVAKLSQRHMRFFRGGDDTIPMPIPPNQPVTNNPNGDVNTYTESLVNEPNNPCGASKPKRNGD